MVHTIATIFTGGGLVEIGARAAGLMPLWGIEHVDEIAQVARNNGLHVITADVCTIDSSRLRRPDVLHASPPCPNFSLAKARGKESVEDIALAQATVRFIETLTPHWFTLENVWLYRRSESWRLIADALNRLGYWMDVQHCNAADFSVPQRRKRMIVRAVRGGFLPPLPPPEPWRGWYQAVEDLLPGLPDSQFAAWQLARMPEELQESLLVDSAGYPDENGIRVPVMRKTHKPANTIVANFAKRPMRAFIVSGQNARQDMATTRTDDLPMFTVVASACDKGMPRAAISSRIVRMTPRCLARFQSIPDDYLLPDKATLAVKIIGNAVPPLLMQRILESLT